MSRAELDAAELTSAVYEVEDPELPHVTIGDLGMVFSITPDHDTHRARVVICPTYTGCPATEQIIDDVVAAARSVGWDADVEIALSPAWSTDWITDRGRERLDAAGIAPPGPTTSARSTHGSGISEQVTMVQFQVRCPRCRSRNTEQIAEFGSTACKASYRCDDCGEPFDYFKAF